MPVNPLRVSPGVLPPATGKVSSGSAAAVDVAQISAPLRAAMRYRKLAEDVDPSERSGVVTGARLVLWLGSQRRGGEIMEAARALRLDPRYVRRSIELLTRVGLLQAFQTRAPTSSRSIRVFTLPGGFDVVSSSNR